MKNFKIFFKAKWEFFPPKKKALLIYETLSGDEIKDLILKNAQPKRTSEEDDKDKKNKSSSLGSLGLKPKPAL